MNRKIIYNIVIFALTILVFLYSNETINEFKNTSIYLFRIIIPSLFPFMIFVNFLLNSDCLDYLATKLNFLKKIFNLSSYGLICIISSIICGYPYGSILITNLKKENKISDKEVSFLLKCTFFPSISFLFFILLKIDSLFILNIISIYLTSFIFIIFNAFIKK